jgi:Tn7-like transposition protein D/TniQ
MSVSFPDPYPNECLYSILSRDIAIHRYSNPLRSIEKNYGTSNRNAFGDLVSLPTSLDRLVSNLPKWQAYDVDEIINGHTLYKLMVFGRKKAYQTDIFEAMKSDGASTLKLMNGFKAFRQGKSRLLYCEDCVRNDRELYGEAYWHREHQASGIWVCPYHDTVLNVADVRNGRYFEHNGFINAERYLRSSPKYSAAICIKSTFEREFLSRMSSVILQMLTLDDNTSLEQTGGYLKEYLLSSGLYLSNSRIALSRLTSDLERYISIDFLDRVGYSASVRARPYAWVGNLVRNCETVANPIVYALMFAYLDLSITEFLDAGRTPLNTERVFQILHAPANNSNNTPVASVDISNLSMSDEAIALRVPETVEHIKQSDKKHGRFVRASFNAIIKELDVLSQLNNRRSRYPLTFAAIKESEEGKLDFCLRRVERTFSSLVQNGEKITKSILITRAGIRIEDYHNEKIVDLIDKLINRRL